VTDRAIAEHVLGLAVEIRETEYVMLDPRHPGQGLELPEFSADEDAAGGLSVLLTQRGYVVHAEEFPLRGWQVTIVSPGFRPTAEYFSETYALAMCGAALKAVGLSEPG
jgi:hypothetical protein